MITPREYQTQRKEEGWRVAGAKIARANRNNTALPSYQSVYVCDVPQTHVILLSTQAGGGRKCGKDEQEDDATVASSHEVRTSLTC
jgi:hypothetical protein